MNLSIVSNYSDSTDKREKLWLSTIANVGITSAELLPNSYYDPGRRVYGNDKYIYKIILFEFEKTSNLRVHDVKGEYNVLRDCVGLPGIPAAIQYQRNNNYELLVVERMDGKPLDPGGLGILKLLTIMCKLSRILFRLACKGICHNDIKSNNVLLTREENVSLIDFDQATRANFIIAIIRSFLGIKIGERKVHGNLMTLVKESLKENLPLWMIKILKKIMGREVDNKLPTLPKRASHTLKTLLKAWRIAQVSDASSPGITVAYYSLNFESYKFPGERPWENRWKELSAITDYSDKRILELGCNMSLLSCFLLKEKRPAAVIGVDVDADILEAARLVATAFNVDLVYKQLNFDSADNWEGTLTEFRADIVFALNVLNWVQDKKRFLTFLGGYNEIIFEGHDDFETECNRFRKMGFKDIKLVHISERKRHILHCRK